MSAASHHIRTAGVSILQGWHNHSHMLRRAVIPLSAASLVAIVVVFDMSPSSGGGDGAGPIIVDSSAYRWSLGPEDAIRWSELVIVGRVEDIGLLVGPRPMAKLQRVSHRPAIRRGNLCSGQLT